MSNSILILSIHTHPGNLPWAIHVFYDTADALKFSLISFKGGKLYSHSITLTMMIIKSDPNYSDLVIKKIIKNKK